MTRKMLFKTGAIAVLGMLAVATLAIIWTSGDYGRVAIGVSALVSVCVFIWRSRRPILAWVDATMDENPFYLGAIAVGVMFICIIGGGGAYGFLGGSLKDAEPFFYPIGVAVILLMFFCVLRFTERHHPKQNK